MPGRPPVTATPGIYHGGTYRRQDPNMAAPSRPRRLQRRAGTVYGGQTGLPTTANADAPIETSGSLTGVILSRGRSSQAEQLQRRKERRARLKTALFVAIGAVGFIAIITLIVTVLAGDFILAIYHTLAGR
jgi:hypothetical protein